MLRKLTRPVVLMPLLVLFGALVVDLAQLVRPSGVSAAVCSVKFFAPRRGVVAIVTEQREALRNQAAVYRLPPELLAAVIINHQINLSSFRRFTDCFGSALGADLSIGLAQVRLSTAADIDGTPYTDMTASEFRQLRTRLLQPASNIEYQAREFRALLERERRYPGIDAEALLEDPFAMALAITEYRIGRRAKPSEDSRPRGEAFAALRIMRDDTLRLFGREEDEVQRIQQTISDYLDAVYCEDQVLGEAACLEWRRSEAGAAAAD